MKTIDQIKNLQQQLLQAETNGLALEYTNLMKKVKVEVDTMISTLEEVHGVDPEKTQKMMNQLMHDTLTPVAKAYSQLLELLHERSEKPKRQTIGHYFVKGTSISATVNQMRFGNVVVLEEFNNEGVSQDVLDHTPSAFERACECARVFMRHDTKESDGSD